MENSSCPLVQAITASRTGGFYNNEDEDGEIVRVGAGPEYICNDTAYYINLRLIEIARLEIQKPSDENCQKTFNRLFQQFVGKTRYSVYRRIIDESHIKTLICRQIISLIDSINKFNHLLILKIAQQKNRNDAIFNNISIGDPSRIPDITADIVYDPDILCETANSIISYVNMLKIPALIKKHIDIKTVNAFTADKLNMDAPYPNFDKYESVDVCIANMKKMVDFEVDTAKYVQEIEKYQCYIINHLNPIHEYISEIISQF